MNYAISYPALNGETVTEGHAKYCADNGHATHKVDGVASNVCPRCGSSKKITPQERRFNAIVDLQNSYYDGGTRTDKEFNFETLMNEVTALRKLGRTERWFEGIRRFEECVKTAVEIFLRENELPANPETGYPYTREHYTTLTWTEYENGFHWALMQGSTYLTYGNC